jgi:hypothetical protein
MNITDEKNENIAWIDVIKVIRKQKNDGVAAGIKILVLILIIGWCGAFFSGNPFDIVSWVVIPGILFLIMISFFASNISEQYSSEKIGKNKYKIMDTLNKEYYTRPLLEKLNDEDYQIIINVVDSVINNNNNKV